MKIPVANMYHILAYALSDYYSTRHTHIAQNAFASGSSADHPLDLLALILISETERLLRHGLHLEYKEDSSTGGFLRGRIDFQGSIRSGHIAKRQLRCQHDSLAADGALNGILGSTLRLVASSSNCSDQVRASAGSLHGRLPRSTDAPLTKQSFNVRLDRSLRRYSLAIGVCRLIFESLLVDASSGQISFVRFDQDEVAMRDLFERFVRNLLKSRIGDSYSVARRNLKWRISDGSKFDREFVPEMRLDAFVTDNNSALVVETKYVPGPTIIRYEQERLRSAHLYQLFSYLKNMPVPKGVSLSGLLLYPSVGEDLEISFALDGLPVKVKALRLDLPWEKVESDLVSTALALLESNAA